MRKVLSFVAAASLTVAGMGLLGCDHNKNDRETSDNARTSSGSYGTSGGGASGSYGTSGTSGGASGSYGTSGGTAGGTSGGASGSYGTSGTGGGASRPPRYNTRDNRTPNGPRPHGPPR